MHQIQDLAALFPIIGLITAVSLTQVLRRRKMAQLRAISLTQ